MLTKLDTVHYQELENIIKYVIFECWSMLKSIKICPQIVYLKKVDIFFMKRRYHELGDLEETVRKSKAFFGRDERPDRNTNIGGKN